jgi:hypothetical protein
LKICGLKPQISPGNQPQIPTAPNFNSDQISEITSFGSHHHPQLVLENYNQGGFEYIGHVYIFHWRGM